MTAASSSKVPEKIMSRERAKRRRAGATSAGTMGPTLLFLLPITAVVIGLYAWPLAQALVYSFTDYRALGSETHFVALANYRKIFSDPSMLTGLGFTVMFTVFVTLFTTLLAIPLAVVLNIKFMGNKVARALFFFLGVPSQAIIGLVWQYIFSPLNTGALNSVLAKLNLPTALWLADPTLARWCIIFVAVWSGVGWHATLYLAYLQAIPQDLYEQSLVDGANPVQQFFHITLPQLTPAITVSTFLLVTGGLKIYDLPYAMTGGGPGVATNTVTQQIILQGVSQGNYGVGSALSMLFLTISVVIVLLQVWVVRIMSRRFA